MMFDSVEGPQNNHMLPEGYNVSHKHLFLH
jgi:hypothetical protein